MHSQVRDIYNFVIVSNDMNIINPKTIESIFPVTKKVKLFICCIKVFVKRRNEKRMEREEKIRVGKVKS